MIDRQLMIELTDFLESCEVMLDGARVRKDF
jgi:hypothetical protein